MPETVPALRHAARRLARSPAFSFLCIGTLALALGAAVAVFSVVDGVLLRPLPYPEPGELVGLWHRAPGLDLGQVPQSGATYLFYRQRARTLEEVALYASERVNLAGHGPPERVAAARVTPSLFSLLRTVPVEGRTFGAGEEEPGAPPVALISHGLWQRRFAGRREVVGSTLEVDGEPRQVVGVLPPSFAFPDADTELWLPLALPPEGGPLARFGSLGVGRLARGTTPEEARAELAGLLEDLEGAFPGDPAATALARAGFTAVVHPLRRDLVGDVGNSLWILLGAVGFVLLIACTNVTNLLLVRGRARRRETAVRAALGASRLRVMGDALAESLVLAAAAGLLGLGLAVAAVGWLKAVAPSTLPRLDAVTVDGRVLLFAALLTLATVASVGLLPALRSGIHRPGPELAAAGGRIGGPASRWTRRLLIAVQLGLALVLLVGSGLMLRSFGRLAAVDPGFRTGGALTFEIAVPPREIPTDADAHRRFRAMVEALADLPEVEAAGATSSLPLGGSAEATGHVVEGAPRQEGEPPPVFEVQRITPGYLEALGIPLLQGRALEPRDAEERTGAVLVSRGLARRHWPGGDALGRRLRPARGAPGPGDPWYTVVGVVGDVRGRRLTEPPRETVYYPLTAKAPEASTVHRMSLVLASPVAAADLLASVRTELSSLAPDLPLAQVRTVEELLARARGRMSFTLGTFLLATAVALFLATVGTYGFISYLVERRTTEIGVRMALGAEGRDIRRLVLLEGLGVGLGGIALGLSGAWWLTRWLGSVLFEVDPLDPWVLGSVPLLLLAVALLASLVPALRAARLDPVEALLRRV